MHAAAPDRKTRARARHQRERLPLLRALRRRLWWRPAAATLFAVLTAVSARLAGFMPSPSWLPRIEPKTIEGLIQIIATSMLAVTTFAVSIALGAASTATGSSTPRALSLVTADSRTQNTLATFIGAFSFSLVSLVAIQLDYYGPNGLMVIFLATLLVLILLVHTLIAWVDHVPTLGRIDFVLRESTHHARLALVAHASDPLFGAAATEDATSGEPVPSPATGYVDAINDAALEKIGEDNDVTIEIVVLPGDPVFIGKPLCHVSQPLPGELQKKLVEAFRIADRDPLRDPRHAPGIIGEVASRALSPAVNDPVTALLALDKIESLLVEYAAAYTYAPKVRHPHLRRRPMSNDTILDATLGQIALDGASQPRVMARLFEVIANILSVTPQTSPLRPALVQQGQRALQLARSAMASAFDKERIEQLAREYGLT